MKKVFKIIKETKRYKIGQDVELTKEMENIFRGKE